MGAIFGVLIIATAVGLIISAPFRNGVTDILSDLLEITFGISRIYAIAVGAVIVVDIIAIIFALLVQSPVFSGLVFLAVCTNFFVVWLPLGVVLKIFKVNSAVVPPSIRSFFAWLSFVAFMAVMAPELFSMKVVIVASILAVFFLALPTKVKFMEKILMPFVVIMLLVVGWQHFFPEDFRSSVRYAQSWSKRVNSSKDRGSIDNETEAATSYAQMLRDIDVLYVQSTHFLDPDTSNHLKRGDVVRLVDHKDAVTVYDGQGFVEIQLKNAQGTYFKGPKYWIEAEFVQIASSRDIVPEDDSLLPKNAQKASSVEILPEKNVITEIDNSVISLGPGLYRYPLNKGEITPEFNIKRKDFCISTDQGDLVKLIYKSGSSLNLWQAASLPYNSRF